GDDRAAAPSREARDRLFAGERLLRTEGGEGVRRVESVDRGQVRRLVRILSGVGTAQIEAAHDRVERDRGTRDDRLIANRDRSPGRVRRAVARRDGRGGE